MAESRDRAAWNRTFAMLAGLYNPNRAKGAQPVDPMRFFPWADLQAKGPPPPSAADRATLRSVFPGREK